MIEKLDFLVEFDEKEEIVDAMLMNDEDYDYVIIDNNGKQVAIDESYRFTFEEAVDYCKVNCDDIAEVIQVNANLCPCCLAEFEFEDEE